MWDFHFKCDSSLCLTAIEWGKEKKQFVGIRFVQLAFLRKMLGTTKYKKERYISPIEPQRCTLQ